MCPQGPANFILNIPKFLPSLNRLCAIFTAEINPDGLAAVAIFLIHVRNVHWAIFTYDHSSIPEM